MNKNHYLQLLIGAVGLLLISFVAAKPAEANPLTCRASALRIDGPLLNSEPVVANPLDLPCKTDSRFLASANVLGIIKLGALSAKTTTNGVLGTAEATTANLSVLNLLGLVNLSTGVLDAKAQVQRVGTSCKLSASSSVTNAVVLLGIPIPAVLTTPLDIPVPLLGTIHLNATIGGDTPTFGPPNHQVIVQRALWIEVTDPLLQLLVLRDVVVSEAIADISGNTCL